MLLSDTRVQPVRAGATDTEVYTQGSPGLTSWARDQPPAGKAEKGV